MMYMELVDLYLLFSRSVRTNDVGLFTYVLERMCPIFFATNRHNYAKWMTRYNLNLLNMDVTHPGVWDILQKGALSVWRTNQNFSRSPIGLSLEQTVNADAASRLSGIAAFNQSVSARKRWMITSTERSTIVGNLLSKAGLVKQNEVHKELKPSKVRRDNEDLSKLIKGLCETMDPFGEDDADEALCCISTDQVIPPDIAHDILSIASDGEKWFNEFRDGRFVDPSRFEKPIPRHKMETSASAVVTI